jgi:fluoroquinolone resistance protein
MQHSVAGVRPSPLNWTQTSQDLEMTEQHVLPRIEQDSMNRSEVEAVIHSYGLPVCFAGVDFSNQDMTRLDLSGCHFERCLMQEAEFTGSTLECCVFRSCRGGMANFRSTKLAEAQFINSDFNNSQWQHAKLNQASFTGCKLTGANFTQVAALGMTFSDTLLIGAYLPGFSFYKTEIDNLDLSDADLSDADFRHAVFVGGSLANARVNGARFDNADLRDTSLQGLKLTDAKLFKGSIISRAQAGMLLAGLGLTVA